jgi:predicted enzyme related to lactoylglutathione lyase
MDDMTEQPSTHHAVDYIEFHVTDVPKARAFYGAVFGWTFTDYAPTFVGFHDTRGARAGEIGAFWQVDEPRGRGPLVHLYSDDLDASLTAVVEAGGTITREPFPFPGGARFHFEDPCGQELAIWTKQPLDDPQGG